MSNCLLESRISNFAIGALLILMLFVIPASASPTIDIWLGGTPLSDWNLNPGPNEDSTHVTLTVTVSSDATGWTVKVKDGSENVKPQTFAGRMVEWDGTQYVTNPKVLGSNLSVEGGQGTGYTKSLVSELSGTDQVIETGTNTGTFSNIPITFRQTLTYFDPRLTAGHSYQIMVTFTGGVS